MVLSGIDWNVLLTHLEAKKTVLKDPKPKFLHFLQSNNITNIIRREQKKAKKIIVKMKHL